MLRRKLEDENSHPAKPQPVSFSSLILTYFDMEFLLKNKIPPDIIFRLILPFADLMKVEAKFSSTCKKFHTLFQPSLNKKIEDQIFLNGELKAIESLLTSKPELLVTPRIIKDHCGRQFEGTPWCYAFATLNQEVYQMIEVKLSELQNGSDILRSLVKAWLPEDWVHNFSKTAQSDEEAFKELEKSDHSQNALNRFSQYLATKASCVVRSGMCVNTMLFWNILQQIEKNPSSQFFQEVARIYRNYLPFHLKDKDFDVKLFNQCAILAQVQLSYWQKIEGDYWLKMEGGLQSIEAPFRFN